MSDDEILSEAPSSPLSIALDITVIGASSRATDGFDESFNSSSTEPAQYVKSGGKDYLATITQPINVRAVNPPGSGPMVKSCVTALARRHRSTGAVISAVLRIVSLFLYSENDILKTTGISKCLVSLTGYKMLCRVTRIGVSHKARDAL